MAATQDLAIGLLLEEEEAESWGVQTVQFLIWLLDLIYADQNKTL